MNIRKSLSVALLASAAIACGFDDDSDSTPAPPTTTTATFEVTVTNLTLNQPLSPPAIILHNDGYNAFADGSTASVALEELAEGGSNTALLAEAEAASGYLDHTSTSGPIGGATTSSALSLEIPVDQLNDLELSVVTMLVNTNDAFTGLNGQDISGMSVGDTRTYLGPTWDSGTEDNSEAAGTIPGPADGGAGFDAARDDAVSSVVRFHQGVVTADDGLSASILDESHRFDNPSSRVTIVRTQ